MNKAQQVLHYLQGQREAMVDLLSRLVLAESPSTSPEAQAAPFAIMSEALDKIDYSAIIIPGQKTGGHLLAHPKSHEPANHFPQQLLLGHCDTVWPQGTLAEMPLVVEDNTVRGPGAFDMKGGLTQMVFALKSIKDLGLDLAVAPLILVNSDEEIGTFESRPHIERLAQQAQRVFVLEPALGLDGKLKTGRKGVGTFTIVVHGKAAHAGLDPEKGVSAILALAKIVQELYSFNDLQRGVSVSVGMIEGGQRSNVIASLSKAIVDVRALKVADAQQIERAILNLKPPMAGIELEITGGFNRPPLELTARNEQLLHLAVALAADLGLSLQHGTAGGGSDGNFTSQYTATLDGLGPVGDGAHARHEFLFIDKMIERAALLALLLLQP